MRKTKAKFAILGRENSRIIFLFVCLSAETQQGDPKTKPLLEAQSWCYILKEF